MSTLNVSMKLETHLRKVTTDVLGTKDCVCACICGCLFTQVGVRKCDECYMLADSSEDSRCLVGLQGGSVPCTESVLRGQLKLGGCLGEAQGFCLVLKHSQQKE